MTNSTVFRSINTDQEELDIYEELQPRNLRNCLNKTKEIMSRKDKREFAESKDKKAAKKFSFRNTRYTEEY